ncbi:MAG TPA: Rieske 2Fe-2S domain-containing protein [Nannocystaceae bacterium]|nr:Rieske 2Fe-2S domain-containing protein [Nannocystaceae bacterium]
MRRERVAALADLWDGEMRGYRVAGARVLLVRIGDSVRAYADRCPHLGVPLSEGSLDGGVITCRAHQYQYDAASGAGVNPRALQLHPYSVTLVEGVITVEIDEP